MPSNSGAKLPRKKGGDQRGEEESSKEERNEEEGNQEKGSTDEVAVSIGSQEFKALVK